MRFGNKHVAHNIGYFIPFEHYLFAYINGKSLEVNSYMPMM